MGQPMTGRMAHRIKRLNEQPDLVLTDADKARNAFNHGKLYLAEKYGDAFNKLHKRHIDPFYLELTWFELLDLLIEIVDALTFKPEWIIKK